MVDLDIGTENLRWLGDSRFVYGFVRGALANKARKVKIQMKVVENGYDKVHLARLARELSGQVKTLGGGTLADGMEALKLDKPTHVIEEDKEFEGEDLDLPMPIAPSVQPDDSWVTITSQGKSTAPAWKQGEGILYIK